MGPRVLAGVLMMVSLARAEPSTDWTKNPPVETRVASWNGCLVDARSVGVALSVDGTSDGTFVRTMWGQRGQLSLDPVGESGARITFGVVTFDTKVALPDLVFRLSQKPAPLGQILFLNPQTRMHIIGGNKSVFELAPIDDDSVRWTSPPRVAVRCDKLGVDGNWSPEPMPRATKQLFPAQPYLAVRAAAKGPIVAHIQVESVGVLDVEDGVVRFVAELRLGFVIGFTDASQLRPSKDEHPGTHLAGNESGGLRPGKAICPFGVPIYLAHDKRLFHVGSLRNDGDPPSPKVDWRRTGRTITLGLQGTTSDGSFAALADDLRVTNALWHDGLTDKLIVPLGENACSMLIRKQPQP